MKRLEDLGAKKLTRDQQKKVAGGATVTCACNNGTAYICRGSLAGCLGGAVGACGGSGALCYASEP